MPAFKERIRSINPDYIRFDRFHTLQLNLGNLCNLQCSHCHVSASPAGNRIMGREVMDTVIGFLKHRRDLTLDLTGGCPEMNPHFRFLIEGTSGLSPRRIVRTNLTVLCETGMEWLPEFFLENRLVVIASLPCYMEDNVDRQRGKGVFLKSIKALRTLNGIGYGDFMELNLAYNPGGEFLPGSQEELESAYKEHLYDKYGVRFNKLYTITNAPVGRFRKYLEEKGEYERYIDLLASSFNPETAPHIMCRTTVSVDWQGILYNCDFNQAVNLPITTDSGTILRVNDLENAAQTGAELALAQHCFCCTAGEGSSCTGSLAA
jgi:radical SAM/Cys-rich protein